MKFEAESYQQFVNRIAIPWAAFVIQNKKAGKQRQADIETAAIIMDEFFKSMFEE